ncbi:MAG: ABC transporter ATP-binding protein [Anaerolineaceae bacterium]
MASVVLKNVSKLFIINNEPFQALKDISFEIGEQEFVSIIGPSGCGKSTILRLIGGLLFPDEGEIDVCGMSPTEARKNRMYSFVFQDAVLFPWRSVIQNVQLPMEINQKFDKKASHKKATELLKLVGLSGFEEASPNQLSGGMRHRVALARALMSSPPLIFMDEPFAALDEITRDRMNLELLRIWSETKSSIVFVTHSIEEAVFLSDRVIVLSTRPGEKVADIKIDLPRPRKLELKQNEESFVYSNEIRKLLASVTQKAAEQTGMNNLP